MGRPKKYGSDREVMKNIVKELYFRGFTMRKIATLLNTSLTTIYNLLKEI